MDWYVYVLIAVWTLWTLVSTSLAMLYKHKLKNTSGRLYVGHHSEENKSELYFEAYEKPSEWKDEKVILVDISYKEL